LIRRILNFRSNGSTDDVRTCRSPTHFEVEIQSFVTMASLLQIACLLALTATSYGFTTRYGSQNVIKGSPKTPNALQTAPISPPRSSTRLFMGWGPDPVWSTATVQVAPEPACRSGICVKLSVAVPPETAASYTTGGQYVQVRANAQDEKPLFLAIASPPNPENASFEFLIKKTENNAWITDASLDTALDISQVLGNGFNMADEWDSLKYDFPTQNVLLLANGSGLAPIRASLPAATKDRTNTRLYYGVRDAADLCFVDEYTQWQDKDYYGLEVVPVVSQPSVDWQGRTGYVQTALEEDGIAVPRNTGVLICGVKGMAEASRERLVQAGVYESRVLFNF